jgi:phosphoribosylformylglycinamidine cyclo-ligase
MPNPYAASGVDTEAGDKAVELMKAAVSATHSNLVLGGVGGFAGMIDAKFLKDYDHPILATSTDGVGTKVAIAQAIDKHDTIGQDLVGMVVDDIVVVGARSLFMTDYIATGKIEPTRIADIVRGIASACKEVDVALVGGETAEHPGLLGEHEYDVAGAAVGGVGPPAVVGAGDGRAVGRGACRHGVAGALRRGKAEGAPVGPVPVAIQDWTGRDGRGVPGAPCVSEA